MYWGNRSYLIAGPLSTRASPRGACVRQQVVRQLERRSQPPSAFPPRDVGALAPVARSAPAGGAFPPGASGPVPECRIQRANPFKGSKVIRLRTALKAPMGLLPGHELELVESVGQAVAFDDLTRSAFCESQHPPHPPEQKNLPRTLHLAKKPLSRLVFGCWVPTQHHRARPTPDQSHPQSSGYCRVVPGRIPCTRNPHHTLLFRPNAGCWVSG